MKFIKQFGIVRIEAKDLPASIFQAYPHSETLYERPRMDDWNSCGVYNLIGNIALTNGVWFNRGELVGKSKLTRGMGPGRIARILYGRLSGINVAQTFDLTLDNVEDLTLKRTPVMICRRWWEHGSDETHYDTLLGVAHGRLFWHNPSKPNGAGTDGFCCMPAKNLREYLELPVTREGRRRGLKNEHYGLVYADMNQDLPEGFEVMDFR